MDAEAANGAPEEQREDNRGLTRLLIGVAVAIIILILLWLLWPRFAVVPNIVGMPQEQAKAELQKAGFSIGVVATRTVDTTTAGNVVGQLPPPGMRIAAGSAIDYSVAQPSGSEQSTGYASGDVSSIEPKGIQVPSVVGKTLVDARKSIYVSSLRATTKTANSAMPIGEVVHQSPGAGVYVDAGTNVELTISSGTGGSDNAAVTYNGPIIPNALGKTISDARGYLRGYGYGVRVVYGPSASTRRGYVYSQRPAPGPWTSNPGSIQIWVSTGPPQNGDWQQDKPPMFYP